eukprot:scaffold190927_cov56-Attheya_sp.AAC.1
MPAMLHKILQYGEAEPRSMHNPAGNGKSCLDGNFGATSDALSSAVDTCTLLPILMYDLVSRESSLQKFVQETITCEVSCRRMGHFSLSSTVALWDGK